jgi:hypothetical protein
MLAAIHLPILDHASTTQPAIVDLSIGRSLSDLCSGKCDCIYSRPELQADSSIQARAKLRPVSHCPRVWLLTARRCSLNHSATSRAFTSLTFVPSLG